MSDTATMDPTQTIGTSSQPASGNAAAEAAAQQPKREEEPEDAPPPTRPDASATSRDAATKGLKHLFRHF